MARYYMRERARVHSVAKQHDSKSAVASRAVSAPSSSSSSAVWPWCGVVAQPPSLLYSIHDIIQTSVEKLGAPLAPRCPTVSDAHAHDLHNKFEYVFSLCIQYVNCPRYKWVYTFGGGVVVVQAHVACEYVVRVRGAHTDTQPRRAAPCAPSALRIRRLRG